jgi:hypothetical protein
LQKVWEFTSGHFSELIKNHAQIIPKSCPNHSQIMQNHCQTMPKSFPNHAN